MTTEESQDMANPKKEDEKIIIPKSTIPLEEKEDEDLEEVPTQDDIVSDDTPIEEEVDEKELKKKLLSKDKRETRRRTNDFEDEPKIWEPRTDLGKAVKNGEIKSMHEVIKLSTPIKEVGLVDYLLPELGEEVLDVGRVQRVTDSGRRMRFRVVTAVGNSNGYVGVGESKGKEAGPTIRKSIERAKMQIIEIKRGCGSWECGCGEPHTVPFKVTGESGSVRVTLVPAPRGVGIVSGRIAKTVLSLAGIKDVWVMTDGHTRTGLNFAHAVVKALENTNYMKITEEEQKKLKIISGAVAKAQEETQDMDEKQQPQDMEGKNE
jgi:small subunit ribosomal protein S5